MDSQFLLHTTLLRKNRQRKSYIHANTARLRSQSFSNKHQYNKDKKNQKQTISAWDIQIPQQFLSEEDGVSMFKSQVRDKQSSMVYKNNYFDSVNGQQIKTVQCKSKRKSLNINNQQFKFMQTQKQFIQSKHSFNNNLISKEYSSSKNRINYSRVKTVSLKKQTQDLCQINLGFQLASQKKNKQNDEHQRLIVPYLLRHMRKNKLTSYSNFISDLKLAQRKNKNSISKYNRI